MPALPTITVTQAQADKIILAFGVDQTTAIAAYKDWLTVQVREFVIRKMAEAKVAENAVSLQATVDAVEALLPAEPPIVLLPT